MNLIYWYYLVIALLLGSLISYIFRKRIERFFKIEIIRWYPLVVLIFALVLFPTYLSAIKNPLSQNEKLDIIGQVAGSVFVIFVGTFALLQLAAFLNANKEQRLKSQRQFINSIRDEVNNAGWWTGLHNQTGGYKPGDEAKFRQENSVLWLNPLISEISPVECAFVQNANLLPGLDELVYEENEPKNGLTGLLTGYLLWCKKFNNYLFGIQSFISSQSTFSVSISNKYKQQAGILSQFQNFNLTVDENNFILALAAKYEFLFFCIVGCNDEKNQHLYYYHTKLLNLLMELEKNVAKDLEEFNKYNFFKKLYQ